MREKTFVDTSGLFAFLNKSDTNHEEAARRMSEDSRKVTSSYIFDELMTLLTARGQKDLSVTFGELLRSGSLASYHLLASSEEERAWQVYKKYRDHPLSFTDCTTLVLVRQYKIPHLLSFDENLLQLFSSGMT